MVKTAISTLSLLVIGDSDYDDSGGGGGDGGGGDDNGIVIVIVMLMLMLMLMAMCDQHNNLYHGLCNGNWEMQILPTLLKSRTAVDIMPMSGTMLVNGALRLESSLYRYRSSVHKPGWQISSAVLYNGMYETYNEKSLFCALRVIFLK